MPHGTYPLTCYFSCIGINQPTDLDLESLTLIVQHHLISFPYQNTKLYNEGQKEPQERHTPSLNVDTIFDTLVTHHKGGYCYQNSLLLLDVLKRLGFNASVHLSTVILKPEDQVDLGTIESKPKTHVALKVIINGAAYLIDTGFANESLRQPIPLHTGEQQVNSEWYRLDKMDDIWQLNILRKKGEKQYWQCLYLFNDKEASENELEKSHHDLYHADCVPIRSDFYLFGSVSEQKRKYAIWYKDKQEGLFKSLDNHNVVRKEKHFSTEPELLSFAERKFKLHQ